MLLDIGLNVLLGLALGTLGGLFGIGGGLIAIPVLGVLFGLAMDYQVFITARMHEDYTHTRDPRGAVERGFVAAAPVVAGAAIIMMPSSRMKPTTWPLVMSRLAM